MDWVQFSIFLTSIIGLFLWNRSESRSDYRNTEAKLESMRSNTEAKLEGMRSMMNTMIQESKDFHGRLCALQEKYYNLKEK